MDRLLASIFGGFWWVLGAKLGWKIEPRAIKNRLKNESKKSWKKDAVWKPLGGWDPRAGQGAAGFLGPPNYQFLKKTTHHSPHTTNNSTRPARNSAVADKFLNKIWSKNPAPEKKIGPRIKNGLGRAGGGQFFVRGPIFFSGAGFFDQILQKKL